MRLPVSRLLAVLILSVPLLGCSEGGQLGGGSLKAVEARKKATEDVARGILKQKEFPLPSPAWFGEYLRLLKEECGVEWENVPPPAANVKNPREEIDAYNSVMRVEIEKRFGAGILEKLREQAQANDKRKREKK